MSKTEVSNSYWWYIPSHAYISMQCTNPPSCHSATKAAFCFHWYKSHNCSRTRKSTKEVLKKNNRKNEIIISHSNQSCYFVYIIYMLSIVDILFCFFVVHVSLTYIRGFITTQTIKMAISVTIYCKHICDKLVVAFKWCKTLSWQLFLQYTNVPYNCSELISLVSQTLHQGAPNDQ